jgi:capsular polysaccharide biosynthesis protein
VLVFAAGLTSVLNRPVEYAASASVLITPKSGDDPISATDTLSRGSLVATFAEVFGSQVVVDEALTKAGIAPEAQERVEVTSRSLSGPSVILIETTADDPLLAEAAADAVAGARPELDGYTDAFGSRVIESATGSAVRSGPSETILVALLVAASAACGIAVGTVSRRFRRAPAPGRSPADTARIPDAPVVAEAEPRAEWLTRRP